MMNFELRFNQNSSFKINQRLHLTLNRLTKSGQTKFLKAGGKRP